MRGGTTRYVLAVVTPAAREAAFFVLRGKPHKKAPHTFVWGAFPEYAFWEFAAFAKAAGF